jgi:hypothetical protein
MGNTVPKAPERHEEMLNEIFRDIDLELSQKDHINLKLSLSDFEKFFQKKIDCLLYFNHYMFKDYISYLYDNYNNKIEKLALTGSMSVLIYFDEEELVYLKQNLKTDFDPLFTIIFERLEINVLLFFNMSYLQIFYINEFFSQMNDNIEMYRHNRKFDSFYILLPNIDIFIKNMCGVFYLSNGDAKHCNDIMTVINILSFFKCKYENNESNKFFEKYIVLNNHKFIKCALLFDLSDTKSFDDMNYDNLNIIRLLIQNTVMLEIDIYMSAGYDKNIANVIKIIFYEMMELQDSTNEQKVKKIGVNLVLQENMVSKHFLKYNLISRVRKYFAFNKNRLRALEFVFSLTQNDEVINYNECVNIKYGSVVSNSNTICYIIQINYKFKGLRNQKIITLLSSFLNHNYYLSYEEKTVDNNDNGKKIENK